MTDKIFSTRNPEAKCMVCTWIEKRAYKFFSWLKIDGRTTCYNFSLINICFLRYQRYMGIEMGVKMGWGWVSEILILISGMGVLRLRLGPTQIN